ncbi:MAG: PAS domain S-box protein [Dehalococcoidia bacterium]
MSDEGKTKSELIEELTQIRQQFILSEDKYRVLIDNTQIPITYLTPDGYILLINKVGAENLGMVPEELVGKSLHEALPDRAKTDRERLARISETGVGLQFEDLISLPEGERWFLSNLQPVKDADGNVFAIQVISHDDTERKQAEEELNEYRDHLEELVREKTDELQAQIIKRERADRKLGESEVRFRAVADTATDGIITINRDGVITYCNPGAATIFGYKGEELIDTPIIKLIPEQSRSRCKSSIQKMVEGRGPCTTGEIIMNFGLRKNGAAVPVELTFARWYIGAEPFFTAIIRDITERVKAEKVIRTSEQKFRSIFENVKDTIVYTDLTGTILDANGKISSLCGYEPEELKGESFTDLGILSFDSVDNILRTLSATVMHNAPPQPIEIEINHRSGNKVIAETSPSMLKMGDGTEGILVIIRDITRRKKAEEALKESERNYRELVENAGDIIYTHDLEGNFTSVNPMALRVYGYEKEEVLDLNISQIVDPAYMPIAQQRIQEKLEGLPDRGPTEILTYRKDGTPVWLEVNTRLIEKDGHPVGIQGIGRDVTERKQAEEKLKESEEKYRLLVENINDAIFSVDTKGYFNYASPVAEQIWGHKIDEIVGRHFTDFVVPDDIPKLAASFERTMNGQVEPSEFRMIDKGGTIHYVRTSSRLLLEEDRPVGLTGIVTDITDRKQAEEKLLKLNKELTALNTIAQTMIQPLDLDSILNNALDRIVEILDLKQCFVSLIESNNQIVLRAQRGIPDKYMDTIKNWNLDEGILGQAVRSGKPRLVESIADFAGEMRDKVAKLIINLDLGPVMYVPLRVKGETLGTLVGIKVKNKTFTAEEQDLLITIGHQLSTVVENALLYEELHHEGEVRREGLRNAILAQEEERRRIARELHDQTSQVLTGASAMIEAAVSTIPMELEGTKETLIEVRSSLTNMLVDVRNIIYELRPTLLDDLGLVAAARWQTEDFLERSGVTAKFKTRGRSRKLPPEVETALFRIIQEATTNIVKHSQAGSARLEIEFSQDAVALEIEDDGKGFDLQNTRASSRKRQGLGLVSMRERAEILGGTFEVASQPGEGTRIKVAVPI